MGNAATNQTIERIEKKVAAKRRAHWVAWADGWLEAADEGRVMEARQEMEAITQRHAHIFGTEAVCAAGDALQRMDEVQDARQERAAIYRDWADSDGALPVAAWATVYYSLNK